MKNIFLVIAVLLLLCEAWATSIAVPSLGKAVRDADVIVKGNLSVDEANVVFFVESSVKGKYRSSQVVKVVGNRSDIFFDLVHYVLQLQGQPCFVLGVDRNGEIYLPWNAFSVWPQGILREGAGLEDIDTCKTFIDDLLKYEHLEFDPDRLVASLLSAVQDGSSRPAALAYLRSMPNIFQNDRALERDLLSVVAPYISSYRIYDEWTVSCMLSLSPSMPQSITIPYFMEVVKTGGKQGGLAQAAVIAALRIRHLTGHEAPERESLPAIMATTLPTLRALDARKYAHLFDASNNDIAKSAGLVFSGIFDEPRPSGKSINEEKLFWMNKISNQIN